MVVSLAISTGPVKAHLLGKVCGQMDTCRVWVGAVLKD